MYCMLEEREKSFFYGKLCPLFTNGSGGREGEKEMEM